MGTFVADGIGSAFYGYDLGYSPDGRWLAVGGYDSIVRVWDVASGELRHSLSGHAGELRALAWADDSEHLVSGSMDGVALLWEISDEGYRRVLSFASQDLPGGIAGAAFEPGGARVLLGGNIVDTVKIWDTGPQGDGEVVNLTTGTEWPSVGFMSEGAIAVSGGEGEVIVFDTKTGTERQVIEADANGFLYGFEVSPDGRAIAAVGDDQAWLWDADTERAVHVGPLQVRAGAWHPDGQRFAASVDGTATVRVFERTGSLVSTSRGDAGYQAVALDVNNEGVMAVGEIPLGRPDLARNRVTIRDGATGEPIRVLPAEGLAYTVAFDPGGQRLALSYLDGRVEIRDLATDAVTVLAGHVGNVNDVTWANDGSRLATSGGDGTIRIWDARTGEPKLVLRGHQSQVGMIRFSPAGSSLASTGQDGTVRVWALDLDDLIEVARQNVTRELSGPECRRYLHLEACPTASP